MPAEPPIEGGLRVTQEPNAISATAVVSLEREAEREGLSVADQVRLRDADLRQWMADRIVPAFLTANRWTLIALAALVLLDEINLIAHLGAPRITSQVVMTLLGATTVQVGVIAGVMARYLFPGR